VQDALALEQVPPVLHGRERAPQRIHRGRFATAHRNGSTTRIDRLTAVILACADAIMCGEDTRATAILEAELGRLGYACWTGILEAERYGVPQTRERAFLLARLDGTPCPPAPTHQRYVPGEGQRHDVTLEGEILPWVSMAEALGWDGAGYRLARGEGFVERHGDRRAVPMDEPAPCISTKARTADWVFQATNDRPNVARRPSSAPALAHGHNAPRWVADRPATNVNGDPRISAPGHHDANESDSIRVTVAEAAILQGFPPDYPWQGSRTAQFQQVGNAVPPPLALAVLAMAAQHRAVPLDNDAIPAEQRATHWDRRQTCGLHSAHGGRSSSIRLATRDT
jgi:site-specific DNA-cytosine methylase